MEPFTETVPLEIIEAIIDVVSSDDDQDHKTLKACSLTCRILLPVSRKHIFYSIFINTNLDKDICSRFSKLLENAPWIADLVRELQLLTSLTSDVFDPPMLSALDRLTKLNTLFLRHSDRGCNAVWPKIPPLVRSAFLRLMHLPTIYSLGFQTITQISPSDLSPCANLRHLSLQNAQFEMDFSPLKKTIQLDRLDFFPPQNFALLCQNSNTNSKLVFDVRRLKHVSFSSGFLEETFRILKDSSHLESIYFVIMLFKGGHWQEPNFIPALLGFLDTLKVFSLSLPYTWFDTLPFLCRQLLKIAGQNRIEVLTMDLAVEGSPGRSWIRGDAWNSLEKLLLAPGWSSLRRVDMKIIIYWQHREVPEGIEDWHMYEDILRQARNTHLSGLATNEFFDFNLFLNRDPNEYNMRRMLGRATGDYIKIV